MPTMTYITSEEKRIQGDKHMKDRLTLALCAKATGDCKIKPLLVYHSETPDPLSHIRFQRKNTAVYVKGQTQGRGLPGCSL